ncbi:MAG: hypothetical protein JXM70_22845 [Pirellulales bacterium]|nr:hypothetical protein [Pirellulales bacterium]
MSEYQYVAFRAVDRPLTDAELKYAEKQSTRAEISRWSFENEYHWGDFRGNVDGLLKRGYDIYLHYANFGIRTVAFRLSAGLPFPKSLWSQYIEIGELKCKKDQKGEACIVSLNPYHELGEIEEIWNPGEYMEDMVEMRRRLVVGDPRALYTLWLCAAMDDESVEPDIVEPPVPGGLSECVEEFGKFLEFFGLDPLVLIAAAEGSTDAPKQPSREQLYRHWVEQLSAAESKQLVLRFLSEDANTVQTEIMTAVQRGDGTADWPMVSPGRTFEKLLDRTSQLRTEHDEKEKKKRAAAAKREAAKKEKKRQERMKKMVEDPKSWLREATKLVNDRGTENYKAAADILADLREAVGGDEGEKITRVHAAHLAKKHPTLTHLKSSLRKRDLLE